VSKYLRWVVSAALLSVLAWQTSWADVVARFADLRAGWWCAAFVLLLLGLTGSARRWQIYANEVGFDGPWWQFCTYYFVGMFFNLVLPTSVGGDVVRVVYLNDQGSRKWPAFVSVLLERASGLMVLIAFACVGLFFCPFTLPAWVLACVWGSAAGSLLAVLVVRYAACWRWLSQDQREQLRLIIDLLQLPRLWARTAMLSVLTQAAGVVVVWCLAMSIGLDVPFAYVCVFAPMLTLLMLLPVSVGGMGVREGGMVLFLAPLGIDTGSALTLAFLLFSVGAAISLLGGLLYLLGVPPARLNPAAAGLRP
jgi:uncharacterized membrane protein YbhN (UPF0104 family)